MLVEMLKILVFVVLVGLVALVAGVLAETDGSLVLVLGGSEFTLAPLQAAILFAASLIAFWVFTRILSLGVAALRFVAGDETAISRYFERNRSRRGYRAVTDAMVALASGDGTAALAQAAKAERNLDRSDLTDLLAAQAAELAGDRERAREIYRRLTESDATRFVGLRGLLRQKVADGDMAAALKLAEGAFALQPRHADTQDVLLRLQARRGDWRGARKTLDAKRKSGGLPRDVHARRAAVLSLAEAMAVDSPEDGAAADRGRAAIEANGLSPDLVPAAAMAARAHVVNGDLRKARRTIRKAWESRPHPDLAAAYGELVDDDDPVQRLERFAELTALHPDHRETRLLRAELLLAAEDFPEARRALGDLPERDPDARTLALMAAISRGEGAPEKIVRGWLARAVSAPRGPRWTCENCGHVHGGWAAICENCESLDSLDWIAPTSVADDSRGSGSLDALPLVLAGDDPADAAEPNGQEDPSDSGVSQGSTVSAEDPGTKQDSADGEPSVTAPHRTEPRFAMGGNGFPIPDGPIRDRRNPETGIPETAAPSRN